MTATKPRTLADIDDPTPLETALIGAAWHDIHQPVVNGEHVDAQLPTLIPGRGFFTFDRTAATDEVMAAVSRILGEPVSNPDPPWLRSRLKRNAARFDAWVNS